MADDPKQEQRPQWRRMGRPPLFNNIIETLTKVRDAIEEELVKEREKLHRARENQGGRRG